MSQIAEIERTKRQIWARPGSSHDKVVRVLRIGLPVMIGILAAFLIMAPLSKANGDVSFVLAKDSVDVAKERLRVVNALYRGEDSKGRPFTIHAGSAVQATSKVAVVKLTDMMAQIQLAEGPASLSAMHGRYDMENEIVTIVGPMQFQSSDGYRVMAENVAVNLKTRKIFTSSPLQVQSAKGYRLASTNTVIDLKTKVATGNPMSVVSDDGYQMTATNMSLGLMTRRMSSQGAVTGRLPIGTFTAGRIDGALDSRTVVLDGGAHLHINQGFVR